MPLTRLNNSAFDAQLEGVYFGMWNGSTSVRCFVSHEALTDKAQGSGQAESLDIFRMRGSALPRPSWRWLSPQLSASPRNGAIAHARERITRAVPETAR
jgi:hypothetical protein